MQSKRRVKIKPAFSGAEIARVLRQSLPDLKETSEQVAMSGIIQWSTAVRSKRRSPTIRPSYRYRSVLRFPALEKSVAISVT
jgi:hypothetical protein